jgi:hypothetical protein
LLTVIMKETQVKCQADHINEIKIWHPKIFCTDK